MKIRLLPTLFLPYNTVPFLYWVLVVVGFLISPIKNSPYVNTKMATPCGAKNGYERT